MKSRKKFGKKRIVIVIAAVIAVWIAVSVAVRSKAAGVHTDLTYTTLEKTDLEDTIDVSGTIASNDSHNVYTTLTYPVKNVNVSVGDTVKKGDVLAVLDTANLESDIKQAEYSTETSENAAALNLQKAKSDYENAVSLSNKNLNSEILAADSALDSARVDLKSASDAYDYDKFLYDSGQLSKMELDAAEAKKETAQIVYDKAESSQTIAKNKAEQDLSALKNAYDAARAQYNDKSQRTVLEKQEQMLEDSTIVSPVDGTVTVCSATEGAVPAGILFTVDNMTDLVVNAEVREYDVGNVKVGQNVTIETDATGSEKIAGTVTSVAPSASVSGTGTPTFAVKVAVTNSNSALKIGMDARLNIILQQKSDLYAVPYDALANGENGESFIYAAVQDGNAWKAKKITVDTGLENDVSVEISDSSLQDGMRIVDNPDSLNDGDTLVFAQ